MTRMNANGCEIEPQINADGRGCEKRNRKNTENGVHGVFDRGSLVRLRTAAIVPEVLLSRSPVRLRTVELSYTRQRVGSDKYTSGARVAGDRDSPPSSICRVFHTLRGILGTLNYTFRFAPCVARIWCATAHSRRSLSDGFSLRLRGSAGNSSRPSRSPLFAYICVIRGKILSRLRKNPQINADERGCEWTLKRVRLWTTIDIFRSFRVDLR